MLTEEDKRQLEAWQKDAEISIKRQNPWTLIGVSEKPERFIYELLQNAEDTEAKSISFHLCDEEMTVEHDGKCFTIEDIDSIARSGYSTKKDKEAIGKFGIGFKSVFNLTVRPCIRSGRFHIALKNVIVPVIEDENSDFYEKTEFTFPFKEDVDYCEVKNWVKEFVAESLLFLTHIKEISLHFDEKETLSYRKSEEPLLSNGELKVCKTSLSGNETVSYLLFERPLQKIQIAYKLDHEGQIVEPDEEHKKIFVFFPTTVDSHVNFLIQAPYETTPSRDRIRPDDKNNPITEHLAALVAESLSVLKQEKLLTWDFLKLLPLQERWEDIYRKVHEAISKELREEPLLPTSDGRYVEAEECIIATEAVRYSFEPKDLKEGRGEWIKCEDLGDYYLRKFFEDELKIESFTLLEVAKKFAEEVGKWKVFLHGKGDDWFLKLYKNLCKDGAARNAFKQLPISPLESGGFGKPKPDETYLPLEGIESDYPTVKRTLANEKIAKELFGLYDMKEPDGITEIQEKIAPKYQEDEVKVSGEEYASDMKKIKRIWDEADAEQQNSIKATLRPAKIVRTEEGDYRKAEEVYLPLDELKTWYEGLDKPFVDKDTYDAFGAILEKLGCRKEIEFHAPSLSSRYEKELDGFKQRFEITDLNRVLDQINLERSTILWKILMEYPHIKGRVEYRWTLKDWKETQVKEEPSVVGQLLEACKDGWLYDKQERPIPKEKLEEFSPSQLHADYQECISNNLTEADKLAEQLGMSKDMMSVAEADEKFKKQEQKHNNELAAKDREIEEYKAESDAAKEEIKELKKRLAATNNTENRNRQSKEERQSPIETPVREVEQRSRPRQSAPQSADDGNNISNTSNRAQPDGIWGEQEAYKLLSERYGKENVNWLNKEKESGEHYDMTVEENGRTIYFEVKSTESSLPHTFEFSRWEKEFAGEHGQDYGVVIVWNEGISILRKPEKFRHHKYGLRVEKDDIENSDGERDD